MWAMSASSPAPCSQVVSVILSSRPVSVWFPMTLGDPFCDSPEAARSNSGSSGLGKRHPVEYRPRVEILTQDHAHLPETGDRPDLGVVVEEHVLPDAPQSAEHHGTRERQTGKASMGNSTSAVLLLRDLGSSLQTRLGEFGEDCAELRGSAPPPRRSTSLARSRFSGSTVKDVDEQRTRAFPRWQPRYWRAKQVPASNEPVSRWK